MHQKALLRRLVVDLYTMTYTYSTIHVLIRSRRRLGESQMASGSVGTLYVSLPLAKEEEKESRGNEEIKTYTIST